MQWIARYPEANILREDNCFENICAHVMLLLEIENKCIGFAYINFHSWKCFNRLRYKKIILCYNSIWLFGHWNIAESTAQNDVIKCWFQKLIGRWKELALYEQWIIFTQKIEKKSTFDLEQFATDRWLLVKTIQLDDFIINCIAWNKYNWENNLSETNFRLFETMSFKLNTLCCGSLVILHTCHLRYCIKIHRRIGVVSSVGFGVSCTASFHNLCCLCIMIMLYPVYIMIHLSTN